MNVWCKVYLMENGAVKEVRRISLKPLATMDEFIEQVDELYPIKDKKLKILWKDPESEFITITTNKEFQSIGRPEKLHVNIENKVYCPPKVRWRSVHIDVQCDTCGITNLSGFRYKCLECDDFDLCSKCEAAGRHPEHLMMRMPRPLKMHSRRFSKFARHYVKRFRHSDKEEEEAYYNRRGYGYNYRNAEYGAYMDFLREKERCEAESNKTGNKDMQVLTDMFAYVMGEQPPNVNPAEQAKAPEQPKASEQPKAPAKPKPPEEPKTADDKTHSVSAVNTLAAAYSVSAEPPKECSPVKSDICKEWILVDGNLSSVPMTPPKDTPSAPPMYSENKTVEPAEPNIYHSDPLIQSGLNALVLMGFSNEMGTLTHLLESKNGNLNEVLDIIFADPENTI